MDIVKRDGSKVKFIASKLQTRVEKKAKGLKVDAHTILLDVFKGVSDNITTSEIDNLIAEVSAGYTTKHQDYSVFASRILESRMEKDVKPFFENALMLKDHKIISQEQYNKYLKFKQVIEEELEDIKSVKLDYLGIRTFAEVYATTDKNKKIAETPKYYLIRLATFFSETEEEFKENIDVLKTGYSPPTPTRCNAGTTENQLASCQLHYLKEDSTDGLMDTFKDLAHSSRNKAGIGLAAYNQRSKGSLSSKGWGAAGQLQAMKIANEIMKFFDQGGKRPGSTAWYSAPWHLDIFDFLKGRKVTTHESIAARDMFYALWVEDEFMKRVENKDFWYLFCPNNLKDAGLDFINKYGDDFSKEYEKAVVLFKDGLLRGEKILAEDLWKEIFVCQIETGMPYMLFKDTVNRVNPQSNLGTIKSSNLCVSGDTQILTDKGYRNIKSLEGQDVNVWNGKEYSEVEVFKTGENQEMLLVESYSGHSITCTPYHKFHIQRGYSRGTGKNKLEILEKRANELKEGDKLIKFELPIIEGKKELKYAYTQGFFSGDGCIPNDGYHRSNMIYLYGVKKELLPFIEVRNKYSIGGGKNSEMTSEKAIIKSPNSDRIVCYVPEDIIANKVFVPNSEYTIKDRLEWLAGILDSDGTVTDNNDSQSIQLGSIDKDFLCNIQLMLQTLGCVSKVTKDREASMRLMPKNDGTGESKLYNCKTNYRLLINGSSVHKIVSLGIDFKRLKPSSKRPNRECSTFTKIKSVEELPDLYDTFCFTEPKRNMGMFNGLLTGNCGEVVQYTDEYIVAVCFLASLIAHEFITADRKINYPKLDNSLRIITRNLNISIDKNSYTTKEAEKGAKQQRAIGIGLQGLADVFFRLGISYDSKEAIDLTRDFQEAIHYYTIKGSVEYSKNAGKRLFTEDSIYPIEKGEFHWEKYNVETKLDWGSLRSDILKYGVANSMMNAQMPTATSAQMHGSTESYETLTNNIYTRRLKVGEIPVINKYMVADFEKLGIWNEDLSTDLILSGGSLQGLNVYDYLEVPTKEEINFFENMQDVYKTTWEVSQKARTNICIAMQPFVDQAISMNVFYKDATIGMWSSALFYAWKNGLKTGNYYCRTHKDSGNKNLGVSKAESFKAKIEQARSEPEDCDMCSS